MNTDNLIAICIVAIFLILVVWALYKNSSKSKYIDFSKSNMDEETIDMPSLSFDENGYIDTGSCSIADLPVLKSITPSTIGGMQYQPIDLESYRLTGKPSSATLFKQCVVEKFNQDKEKANKTFQLKNYLPEEDVPDWHQFAAAKEMRINDEDLIKPRNFYINTVTSPVNKARRDGRKEIRVPKKSHSPWNNSTIEPPIFNITS